MKKNTGATKKQTAARKTKKPEMVTLPVPVTKPILAAIEEWADAVMVSPGDAVRFMVASYLHLL